MSTLGPAIPMAKNIRALCKDDFEWVSALHAQKLPDDLVVKLGREFLNSCLYPAFMREGLSLVSQGQGSLLLSADLKVSTLPVLYSALLRPHTWIPLAGAALRSRRCETDLSDHIEICFVFSNPGYGGLLIREAMRQHPRRGFFALTDSADQFYVKMGFSQVGEEKRGARTLRIFAKPQSAT